MGVESETDRAPTIDVVTDNLQGFGFATTRQLVVLGVGLGVFRVGSHGDEFSVAFARTGTEQDVILNYHQIPRSNRGNPLALVWVSFVKTDQTVTKRRCLENEP